MNRLMNRRTFIQGLGILSAGWTAKGWTAPLNTIPFSSSLSQTSETRNLMGTFVTITLLHPSRDQAQAVLGAAFQRLEALIRLFNRHDPGSALSVLNRKRPPARIRRRNWSSCLTDPGSSMPGPGVSSR